MRKEFNDMEHMFAEGLHNHEVTPPAHVWANIKKGKRKGFFYYFTSNKLKTAAILLFMIITGATAYYFTLDQNIMVKSGALSQTEPAASLDQSKQTGEENTDIDAETKNSTPIETTGSAKNEVTGTVSNSESKYLRSNTGTNTKKQLSKIERKSKARKSIPVDLAPEKEAVEESDMLPILLSSKDEIRLKYLVYPSLMQYIYTTKKLFKNYIQAKARDKENEKENIGLGYKFSLEIMGGPSYAFRTLKGGDHLLRDESEKAGLSLQTAIKVNYHFNPTWSIQSGLVIENRNEKIRYNHSEIQTILTETPRLVTIYHPVLPQRDIEVIDSTYSEEVKDFSLSASNRYQTYSIPAVISYNFVCRRIQYRISGGALVHIHSSNSAQNVVRNGNNLILVPYKESTKVKASCYSALGLLLPIGHLGDFVGEVSYYRNMGNRLNSESAIRQKNYGFNLSAGLKINLIK